MSDDFKNINKNFNTPKKAGRPSQKKENLETTLVKQLASENTSTELSEDQLEVKTEVKAEVKTEIRSKKELSEKELSELRAKKKQERMRSMRDRDILNLSEKTLEKLKREGKVAKLAKKENIPMWKSRGYEILTNAEHESSDSVYSSQGASGGIEIQDNKTDPLSKSVWMVTDEENRDILREIEADNAKRQLSQIGQEKVTIDGVTEQVIPGKLTKY